MRALNFTFFYPRNQRGATLVELLLYMGILFVLIGILTTFFGTALDLQLESEATNSVDRDGQYLLARFNYDFHRADDVSIPIVSGVPGQTLSLSIGGVTYTYSLDGGGNLVYANNLGSFTLNSYDTKLSNVNFTKIANVGGVEDTVKISFTISAVYLQHKGTETKNFQTTIAVR
jgi:hypothetical protein